MKKELVQLGDIDAFICRAEPKIHVDANMILTPGAKDELSKRHVAVVYGPCPSAATCGLHNQAASGAKTDSCLGGLCEGHPDLERIYFGVAAMLQSECGITDPAELREASIKAMRTIRENL